VRMTQVKNGSKDISGNFISNPSFLMVGLGVLSGKNSLPSGFSPPFPFFD